MECLLKNLLSLVNKATEVFHMPYTTEEGGRLNNFAIEPKMYEAEPPTQNQKRGYFLLGAVAVVLLGGLFVVAASVS